MIKAENGTIEIRGSRDEVQLEFMVLLDHIKKIHLFKDEEQMKMCTMFALMNDKDQKDCMIEILDTMIKDLEEEQKGKKGAKRKRNETD